MSHTPGSAAPDGQTPSGPRPAVVRPGTVTHPKDALDDDLVARLLARLGPFERPPRLAVAVSGGPDSMAACLLAARWAAARGGAAVGLTVDHGLRRESRAEAELVGAWLAARGIAHTALDWAGPKPTSGIQAAAREARHRLLGDWCRANGVLHLVLGHHLEDQAETAALRAARASGPDGMAGMAAVRELPGLRLLRPFLGVPKARLVATLARMGQPWLDDPSNTAPDFARSRLRADQAWDRAELAGAAARHGLDRATHERHLAAWLVRHARIDPAGFAWLDREALADAADPLAARALRQLLATIGGASYPPRGARLAGLLAWLRAGTPSAGRTLAGCRVLPRGDHLLLCREAGAITETVVLSGTRWRTWDHRFALRGLAPSPMAAAGRSAPEPGLTVRALGARGWSVRHDLHAIGPGRDLPAPVRASLPVIWWEGEVLAIPHLDLVAPGLTGPPVTVRFRPPRPAAGAPFAPAGTGTERESLLRPRDILC